MNKYYILFICFLFSTINSFGGYSIDWIRPADTYLKSGSTIGRDNDDNLVVVGYIQSDNMYTRKYDRFGNFLWERTDSSGVHSIYEKPVWTNCDANNNIYVIGYRYAFSSSWEYPDAIIAIKYDPAGNLLWRRTFAISYSLGSSSGYSFGLDAQIDNNGNLFIGSASTSPSGFVFIKINPAGSVLVNSMTTLGGFHQFSAMRLKDNLVIITGRESGSTGLIVMAWDTSGTFHWSTNLIGRTGNDVEIDDSTNVYVLSSFSNQVSPTSGEDIIIYKLDSSGTQLWKKDYDFGGYDFSTRFTLVAEKLSVIGYGTTTSYFDWLTFQINPSGQLLWNSRYNGTQMNDEAPYAISAKANGEVFVTGKGGPLYTQPNGSSYLRMVTLNYGNTGTVEWLDTNQIFSGWGIASKIASDSSLFILGGTNMTAFHYLDHSGIGTCGIPSPATVSAINDTSAFFSWTAVAGAYLYHLRYKTSTASTWTSVSTNLNSYSLQNLTAGTSYDFAVEAICTSGPSGYNTFQTFTTTGTGYCTTAGLNSSQEYLSYVWIGAIQNSTGNDNGYGDYTNLSTTLTPGSTVYGYLSAFLQFGLTEYYSIWIDFNHDNDFNDPDEQVVNITSDFLGYIAINFTVPANAVPGVSRMRVTMRYDSIPTPCGVYPRGETEDYSVFINITLSTSENFQQHTFELIDISPNPFDSYSTIHLTNSGSEKVTLSVADACGRLIKIIDVDNLHSGENKIRLDLIELNSGIYYLTIESKDQKSTAKLIKY